MTPGKLSSIKALYRSYYKKFCCDRQAFKYFKRLNLAANLNSVILVSSCVIAGGITANHAVLGSISGAGLVLKAFTEIKDYKNKIDMSKFAYTTYEKVLVQLRAFVRGSEFNYTQFINGMKLLDEIIIDICPLADKYGKQYNKIFTSE